MHWKKTYIGKILILFSLTITCVFAQLSGEYTVGSGGNYSTLTAALAAWKNSTITGHVTFRLLNASYTGETYPLRCTIPAGYSGGNWTLTIKPTSGIMSNFTGSAASPLSIFDLKSVQRVTIDSIVFTNTGTGPALRFIAGASHNTIKNCSLKARPTSTTVGVVLFSTSTGATGNNNNLIENCDITTSLPGTSYPHTCINFNGSASPLDNQNNIIKGCRIYDFATRGIILYQNATNTIITENDIYAKNMQTGHTLNGITFYASTENTIHNTQITRNKIRDLKSNAPTPSITGVNLPGGGSTTNANIIANNFIYLNSDTNLTHATIYGITIYFESDQPANRLIHIYYNSIYIGGTDAHRPSYGLYRGGAQTGIIDFRNNIIFNNRKSNIETMRPHYGIYYSITSPLSGFNSNYNDIFVVNAGTDSQYVGYWNGTPQTTLADWQNASGQDINSISVNPDFQRTTPPVDLHINPLSTSVNNLGIPISGIMFDFDGQPRDLLTPDIGADEYTPVSSHIISLIKPNTANLSLTLKPNPFREATIISWNVSVAGEVSLKLYNACGKVVKTLNEGYLASGNYTTRLSKEHLVKGIYFLRYEDNINKSQIKLIIQ